MTAKGTFFPRRINDYVPNMAYAADVRFGGEGTIVIPAPAATNANKFAAALVASAAAKTPVNFVIDAKFGRAITVTASQATGANTTLTVRGKDYLGQPMAETITVNNAAGTTPQVGKKAFKYIDSFEVAVPAAAGTTFAIGDSNVLGLPYKSQKLVVELVNKDAPAAGTFVASPAVGTVQTATTGDPRGTYTPAAGVVPNGSREYELVIMHDYEQLHGERQFYA